MNTRPAIAYSHAALTRRRALALLAVAGASPAAFGQQEGRVRLIVPTSAGSGTDATARALQPGLGAALGVPVIVENMPGAAGVIGLQAVARAAPQDMTLAVITNSLVVLPSVMKGFPLDVTRDFTPISMLVTIPLVLAVNSKVPASNAKELIALLKSKPDALNFGSSGSGSVAHLATEMFLDEAGVKARHIPFQGPNPMTVALIGGQIEFGTQGLSVFQPHFKSGTLRAIGVCSTKRSAAAPDIPTFVEQGLPNLVCEAWVTLLAPKGMAPATVKKLNDATAQAFSNSATKDELTRQGSVVMLSSPEDAQATIRQDVLKFAALVKKIGLTPQ
ncbi:ABC transporter substrate-binding protein [Variovorax sp. WS11]|uniref:Bug family tripartite tricarboxylate transporter substrate binding protein n=1 Tax=Variovorax sp. WS11 TaxID=1105204 RepID=UPI000D0D5391|nr:tripartite tricarboxylate transporter substrate-binding protein [Variovorax sp. WS11]NDZ18796.1 tripartite tricarboxylate transporter substrate binding protein [Variovorax sp. WS11]PSL82571.1 ABC transporter substrate-binding protein [Variovorax sp. WS11]